MNNHIQLVLKSSTTEMSLNDHESGIYIVPELEGLTGLPEIRTTSGVNSGYDGGWTSAQNFDARSITIRGVIANADVATVERMRKQLIALLAQGKNENLTLNLVTEAGNSYDIEVRTIACEMAMQTVLQQQNFLIQLRADDPLIYDSSAGGGSALVQVQHAIGGFEINFELPLAISGGEGESVIQNNGLEQVYPIIKMYGALHRPTFVNLTTNQQIQLDTTLAYAEGDWFNPSETYTGKTIYLEDAPDNAPLASFQLDGETSQNGTPTPSAPVPVKVVTGENVVKICGKNLWGGFASDFSATSATVAFVNKADGSITANGTSTGTALSLNSTQAANNGRLITLAAGTYTVSGAIPPVRLEIVSSSGSSLADTSSDTYASFTLTSTTQVFIRAKMGSSASASNVTVYPMLELGSATAYEPYQGQSYEINLGKNLFDKNNYTDQTGYYIGGSGIWRSGGAGDHYFVFNVEPNTTYTFSKNAQTSNNRFRVGISSGTPTVGEAFPIWGGGDTATEITLTTASDSKYAYVYYSVTVNVQEAIQSLQIEVGSQKTSYAAYFEPIELCKIGDYQDYIYKDGSDWKIHKATRKVILDGTESWSRWSTPNEDTIHTRTFTLTDSYYGTQMPLFGSIVINDKSDRFVLDETVWSDARLTKMALNVTSSRSLQIKLEKTYLNYTDTMTSAELETLFKAWLAAHNTTLYYILATPTDTEITNEALVAQLEAVLGGHTYAGTNNITTITPNEQGTLEISYYTDKEADRRDVVIIDSRMRTVTLNGIDIYHLIEEGSEFPMLDPGENKLVLRSDIPGDNGYAEVNYKQGYLSI